MAQRKIFISLSLVLVLGGRAWAGEEGLFSVRYGSGFLVMDVADNLWGGGESVLRSLEQSPPSRSRFIPLATLDIRYRSRNRKTEYFLGTRLEEMGWPALGVKRRADWGVLEASVFYWPLSRVWEDPYLVNIARAKTYMRQYGAKLSYTKGVELPLTLSWESTLRDVEKDLVGQRFGELRRDGLVHEVSLSARRALGKGWAVTPSLTYEWGALDGKSERYDEYRPSLGVGHHSDKGFYLARISLGIKNHDRAHPVFGEKREEDSLGAFLMASFQDVLGYKGYFMTLGMALERTYSNIAFFGSKRNMLFFVLGRRW